MNGRQEPNWQPVRNLPMIAAMINGQLTEAKDQLINLTKSYEKPFILDRQTIKRTISVFTEQQHYVTIFAQQLLKWQQEENLAFAQKNEINRLQGQVESWEKTLIEILEIANKIK